MQGPVPPMTRLPVLISLIGGIVMVPLALAIILLQKPGNNNATVRLAPSPAPVPLAAPTALPDKLEPLMKEFQGSWEMRGGTSRNFMLNLRVLPEERMAFGNLCVVTPTGQYCPADEENEITLQASGSASIANVEYRDPESQAMRFARIAYDSSDDTIIWMRGDIQGGSEVIPREAVLYRAATTVVPNLPYVMDVAFLTGTWHIRPETAAGWSHKFHFYPSGRFRYTAPVAECAGPVAEQWGVWSVTGNTIDLKVLREELRVIFTGAPGQVTCSNQTEIVTIPEPKSITFMLYPLYAHPVDPQTNPYRSILIGSDRFWKVSDDPTAGYSQFAEPDLETGADDTPSKATGEAQQG
ncbi:MAG: hypothetical protein N2691_04340 [Patescibacteria group bacterium]|nr:hypothetical protein [Patescibacteria group bacterium]